MQNQQKENYYTKLRIDFFIIKQEIVKTKMLIS
jgi:hypothetical protein